MKTALVLGGGGFIGGHFANRIMKENFNVRVVDVKPEHDYRNKSEICNEYFSRDLRDPLFVKHVFYDGIGSKGFDEV